MSYFRGREKGGGENLMDIDTGHGGIAHSDRLMRAVDRKLR